MMRPIDMTCSGDHPEKWERVYPGRSRVRAGFLVGTELRGQDARATAATSY